MERVGDGNNSRRWPCFGLLAALAVASSALPAAAREWRWQLPAARYQTLNQFERRQLDKAAALVERKSYNAAAEEFEKFKADFPDSSLLSYVLLMRGYCLERSNNRNTAIKLYQEVLDFFQDNADDCAAALYHLAMSHFDNGDTAKGMKALQALADDPRYKDHPLTAGAIRRLADDFWTRQQPESAVRYWKQVVGRYAGQNDAEVNLALKNVVAWYVKNRDYAGYEAWLLHDRSSSDAEVHKQLVEHAFNAAKKGFHGDWEKYAATTEKDKREKEKLKTEDMQAFYSYLKANRSWYEKTGDLWRYQEHALQFLALPGADRAAREAAVNDALALVKDVKNKDEADRKVSYLVDYLADQQQYDRARYLLAMVHDRVQAAYKDYELLAGEGKWPQAVARLEEVEHRGGGAWKKQAMWERAKIYKDSLHDYEKAIKLCNEISNPPATLWLIEDAYHRWGKLKESLGTLSEIEAMFPADAPRAAWKKTHYLLKADDKKAAIAQARRIMKMYPKSQESALAHRWLEDNGVASGGGVSDQ